MYFLNEMGKGKSKVDVLYLMRYSCDLCREILKNLSEYMNDKRDIDFKIIDLDSSNEYKMKHSSITPAVWVNNKMWYAGSFDIKKFDKKITELNNKTRRT